MRRLEKEQRLIHLVWYGYPKSDGLTKRDKAQDKKAESQTDTISFHLLQTNYSHTNQRL